VLDSLKTFARSLRVRLTAWNTAVVLLAVVGTLLGLREGLRLALIHEADSLLRDDAKEMSLAVEQFYPKMNEVHRAMSRKALAHTDRGLFLELLDSQGKRLYSTRGTPPLVDLDAAVSLAPQSIKDHRVIQQQLNARGLPGFVLRVGSPLALVEEDVARLTPVIILAIVIVLCVAPLGGYWLAGRATRPLARIITAAARLRPSRMEERLPMRGTGDELDRLSSTINRFLDLIAEHVSRNREFVANAAHELRSPLAAIQSSLEVALTSDRSAAEYQDLLYEIADQCEHLRTLVNQLLLLAETDASRFHVERQPVRVDRLVEKALDMFRGAAEERGITLASRCPQGLTIPGDGNRLRQVINNLIDNGLKFTSRGGRVDIVFEHEPELGQVILKISDTGPGIPAADLPHVFERFYRGDKSRQRANQTFGNGLGLSICQSIVTAHGGTIRVDNNLVEGATFTVCLPTTRDPGEKYDQPRLSYSA